jgi:hypothetical protein
MNKRKKGQTIIYKTLHRKQKIEYVTQTSLKILYFKGCRGDIFCLRKKEFHPLFQRLSTDVHPVIKSTNQVLSSNSVHGEVYAIQHYVIKYVSDLWQIVGFLWVLRFPPPIKLNQFLIFFFFSFYCRLLCFREIQLNFLFK